jgi:hypothetical protein
MTSRRPSARSFSILAHLGLHLGHVHRIAAQESAQVQRGHLRRRPALDTRAPRVHLELLE